MDSKMMAHTSMKGFIEIKLDLFYLLAYAQKAVMAALCCGLGFLQQ